MFGVIAKYLKMSVLRRLLFAVVHLPQDLPNLWGVAREFAAKGQEHRSTLAAKDA